MDSLSISFKNWLQTSSQKQKYTAALFAFGLLSTIGLMLITGSSGTTNDPLRPSPFYFIGVFVKLSVVLLLILACSAIFRRWSVPGTKRGKKHQMEVVEMVRLSPKQTLYIISVGDRQLLLGATDQNVSLLTAVELDLNSIDAPVNSPAVRTDFASLLQTINFRMPAETSSKS